MLLDIDFHEYLFEVEDITITAVFALQPTVINGSELDAPEAVRFTTDSDAAFGK